MSLSSVLTEEGTPADDIQTTARVRLEQKDEGFRITRVTLTCVAQVPGMDEQRFTELAKRAEATCPVSVAWPAQKSCLTRRSQVRTARERLAVTQEAAHGE